MKRIISLILAAAMVLALLPGIALAADEAETISYVIGTNSVSTAPFTGTHIIPMETEGENAGKLSFETGAAHQVLDNTV